MLMYWILVISVVCIALLVAVLPIFTGKTPGETRETGTGFPTRYIVIALGVLLPSAVIALYIQSAADVTGAVAHTTSPASSITIQQAPPASATKTLPSVEAMLIQLEQRLEQEPDDAEGWDLLGRSYDHLGRSDAAEKAFARARELGYEHQSRTAGSTSIVQGTVSLDPSLTYGVSPTDTVFILARAINGPRMPIAVLQKTVAELPISYRLDNSMAMAPGQRLSDYRNVIVSAKILASGTVTGSAGSLEGYSGIVHPGRDTSVNIVVDQEQIFSPETHHLKAGSGKS